MISFLKHCQSHDLRIAERRQFSIPSIVTHVFFDRVKFCTILKNDSYIKAVYFRPSNTDKECDQQNTRRSPQDQQSSLVKGLGHAERNNSHGYYLSRR